MALAPRRTPCERGTPAEAIDPALLHEAQCGAVPLVHPIEPHDDVGVVVRVVGDEAVVAPDRCTAGVLTPRGIAEQHQVLPTLHDVGQIEVDAAGRRAARSP